MWLRRDPESEQIWDEITDEQMGNLLTAVRNGQRPDVSRVLERSDTRVVLAVREPGGASGGTATYVHEKGADEQPHHRLASDQQRYVDRDPAESHEHPTGRKINAMQYSEVDPAGPTANEGDSAGPAQLSVAWGRRFAADLGDGRWDVLDIETVVVDADHHEEGKPARPVVELVIAHTLCTDPADPLGTEVDTTEVKRHELPGDEATEELARQWCATFDPTEVRVPTWPNHS